MMIVYNQDGWATSIYKGNMGETFVARAGAIETVLDTTQQIIPEYIDELTEETIPEHTVDVPVSWKLYKLIDGTPTLQTQSERDTYDESLRTWDEFYQARERILPHVVGYFGTLTVVNITSEQRDQLEAWWKLLCDATQTQATVSDAMALFSQAPAWWVDKQANSSIKSLVNA